MNQLTRLLLGASLAALTLSACTKEIPYDEKFKAEDIETAVVDTQSDYLMSSSMLNASRSSEEALPYSAGDNKRVHLKWTKTSLQVIEMEKDLRFRGNDANNKLVLEIPVDYVDYQCTKDKYGECTNVEEERDDVLWNQKTKFRVKAEAAKSARLEILPILLENDLTAGFCYNETSAEVISFKLEKDAMNLAIRRNFKININCLNSGELSDSTVSAVFHYSLVKTSAVLTPGFKVVEYPRVDADTFGFFATESKNLDAANNATVSGERTIMNHWDPNRTEITYYLSDEFKKKENSKIRELTFKVVDSLNAGLKLANAKFRLNLKDGEGRTPGDIRNSMIVLVEDPVASSVIGYGPQVEDPLTGEIISARTVMFLGTIKSYIKTIYDDILREKKAAKLAQTKVEEPKTEPGKDAADDKGGLNIEDGKKAQLLKKPLFKSQSLKKIVKQVKPIDMKAGQKNISAADQVKLARIQKEVRNYTRQRNTEYDSVEAPAAAHLKYLQEAKNCAFGLNADLISTSISPKLAAAFPDDAKPWDQLSEDEKQAAIDIILPEVWVPTLIHEMGHNLGLRHNFKGSEDPKNFYNNEELAAMGIDHNIPFSTVMEYGDDLKALPVLGKYDVAALRFAYDQKVELADGRLVSVQGTIKDTLAALNKKEGKDGKEKSEEPPLALKEYGYCTDEHTGINAGCRRFDLGTTLTDIILHEIETYESAYESRNKRAGRSDMSLVGDVAYAARLRSKFQDMRLMQETYESIKHRFQIPDDHPAWESNEFLKDIKQASTLVGQFLMNVATTPDLTCVLADVSDPNTIVDAVRLDDLDASQIRCEDVEMAMIGLPNLMVIDHYGKLFQSRKDPTSDNVWADQIDVRGIWLDKLMATRMLFARDLGVSTLDKESDNFTDRPDFAENLSSMLQATLLNRVSGVEEIHFPNGEVKAMNVPYYTKLEVQKPLFTGLANALGVPNANVAYNKVMMSAVANRMIDPNHELSGNAFLDPFRVTRSRTSDSFASDYKTMDISSTRFAAGPENVLAREAMDSYAIGVKLDKVAKKDANGRKRLIELYSLLKAKQPAPADLTADEKVAWDLGEAVLFDYLTGALETPEYFQNLLTLLPN